MTEEELEAVLGAPLESEKDDGSQVYGVPPDSYSR